MSELEARLVESLREGLRGGYMLEPCVELQSKSSKTLGVILKSQCFRSECRNSFFRILLVYVWLWKLKGMQPRPLTNPP